ncbi:hypothetical protein LL14B4_03250 [Lactococcus lactis subsp. lactis]|jgi:multidrug transporter EmrE-like cation transporter|uniref:Uncharacterized protein n=1 Tax=Lactococcus lactis subsp. lactis TaxID=1360 RepID=A0A2Z3KCS6_LACLL|nr:MULTISPECIES: hypothetical protein [Lactococcus]AWN65237.1 hypothetical protein LL14B4_03250 [Lactococcus lactis subsp. lactis]MBK0030037.1 hypothetical protein [Lactococcus sp. S47]
MKKIILLGAIILTVFGASLTKPQKASAAWVGTVISQEKLNLNFRVISTSYRQLRVTNSYSVYVNPLARSGNYYYRDYIYTTW